MRTLIADAFGKAAVAYPFLIASTAAIVAIEATRDSGRPGDAIGWLMWSLLWVTVAALASLFFVVPILAVEFLLWGAVARRFPGVDGSRAAVLASCAVLALPWGIGPWATGWGAAPLVFAGLALARSVVPSLGLGSFSGRGEAGASTPAS